MRSHEHDPILALATDYDRTLTDPDLHLVPEAIEALAHARRAGRKIIIVSGRTLDILIPHVGHVADAIVAENGCILAHNGHIRHLGPHVDLRPLLALDIPYERGERILSAPIEHERVLAHTIAHHDIPAHLIRNRDRIMILPQGTDKATGTLAALHALHIPPQHTAAAGDAENDITLLCAVGHRIAVDNAIPQLKDIATHITRRPGGHGLAHWIEHEWLPTLAHP